MSGRTFLDTNVLVYAFDRDEPEKRARALEVIERTTRAGEAVISVQVLAEFYVTVTRKLANPLAEPDAARAVADLAALPVAVADARTVQDAVALSRSDRLSLWDALIVRSALEAGCTRLLTEDLQHGRRFGRLVVENPFGA